MNKNEYLVRQSKSFFKGRDFKEEISNIIRRIANYALQIEKKLLTLDIYAFQ